MKKHWSFILVWQTLKCLIIFAATSECVYHGKRNKLTKKQELFLVLKRLRLALLEEDLAFRFGINQSRVSRIITKWLAVMSDRRSFLVAWPETDQLENNANPECFKKCAVILDCFEVFIEKPADLVARDQTYLQYKSHNIQLRRKYLQKLVIPNNWRTRPQRQIFICFSLFPRYLVVNKV